MQKNEQMMRHIKNEWGYSLSMSIQATYLVCMIKKKMFGQVVFQEICWLNNSSLKSIMNVNAINV